MKTWIRRANVILCAIYMSAFGIMVDGILGSFMGFPVSHIDECIYAACTIGALALPMINAIIVGIMGFRKNTKIEG